MSDRAEQTGSNITRSSRLAHLVYIEVCCVYGGRTVGRRRTEHPQTNRIHLITSYHSVYMFIAVRVLWTTVWTAEKQGVSVLPPALQALITRYYRQGYACYFMISYNIRE
jgi:hypothetical protein